MSKPVDYCTIEFDFLTGGANETFIGMTVAQRYAYLCVWSYAVHLRKLRLTKHEILFRIGAIYDIDRRTVARMLQVCSKDADLMKEVKGGYVITGVSDKHGKLENWKAVKKPRKSTLPGDSTVQYSTGVRALSELLHELIQERFPKAKKPDFIKWSSHIEKMIRIDGYSLEEIEAVVRWCQADEFWHKNILSTSKLREKYHRLCLDMSKKQKPPDPPGRPPLL